MSTVVELCSVFFTYGCHPVLDEVNLQVNSGDVVGITGPNGAGKTTILKLILGQLQPQKGKVNIFGMDSMAFKERFRLGYISQNARFFNKSFPATSREVVASGRVPARGILRRLRKEDYKVVDEALDTVGMLNMSHHMVGNMSGGQQQKILLARALAAKPQLLIMDEPTAGLDVSGRHELYRILSELNSEKGVTLMLVSHDVEEVSPLLTKQVCLDRKLCFCQKKLSDTGKQSNEACSKRLAMV